MKLSDGIDNLLEVSQDMICILNLDGDFLQANKSFCENSGFTSEELFCNSLLEFIHPDEMEKYIHFFKNFKDGLSTYLEIEYRFIHRSGRILWFEWSFTLLNDNHIFAIARNISTFKDENKFLLKKLSENIAYSNALSQNLPHLIWTADPLGNVDFYNQYCLEFTGMTYEGASGWSWFSLLHPEDREKTLHTWNQSILTGEPYDIEFRIKSKLFKEYRWLHTKAIAYKDEHGKIIKWFGSSTDVNLQKQLQDDSIDKQVHLDKIFDLASLYIWKTNIKGAIIYSYGKIPEEIGLKSENNCGANAFSIFKDFSKIQNGINMALNGEEVREKITFEDCNIEIYFKPLSNSIGEKNGMVGMIQSKVYAENNHDNDSKIIDIINNELRAPLHTIISFSEILEEKIKDEEAKKYLRYIISSGDTMKNFLMNVYNLESSLYMDNNQKDLLVN